MLNLAAIHEAIAAVIPERECLVYRDRRLSWAQITDRTRRLASVLRSAELGCGVPRSQLRNWESGQSHVALYLYNGNEYLEGMLGAFKARCVPLNVNYRYVDEELEYLFENSNAQAIVYHASFAPVLARIRGRLPKLRLWLQVDDGSGEPLLPGALDYEQALAAAEPRPPGPDLSPDDLYMLYTGGTTGMPKGVLWRQEDILRAALYTGDPGSLEQMVERAKAGGIRSLPAPPFMHGAAHWVAFNMWHVGGTIVVQDHPRHFDPHDIWSTIEREKVNALTIVGDAFGRPLADQLRKRRYDLSAFKLLTSGGAILTAALKQEFLELLPEVRILDALGSSESGAQAMQFSASGSRTSTGDFALAPGNVVLKADLSGVIGAGSSEQGWLARSGYVPLGYYGDEAKTAKTFPVVDGVRYSVPGDRAGLDEKGMLRLFGRDSVTINSGGEKIFAEEVEHALKHHPSVYDAVVVGTPHDRWGQQVTALVQLREGERPSEAQLCEAAGAHVAAYKLPKLFVFVDEILRSPSGKADYRWAKATALARLNPPRA
ncbi:MAG TPA: acyl-CoA synthetase [Myxococcota bacterium]|jgi:fatty-acyl-CoA synthase